MGFGRGRGGEDEAKGACACCCSLVFMASIIMVGCSFDTLDPLTAGIEFNSVSKKIATDRVYTSGRYFLGLGKEFLEFPMNFQNIEYSQAPDADRPPLVARSSKGQISLECSLQYTLKLDRLVTIYSLYERNYHQKFVEIAQNAIKNRASEVLPEDFYERRRDVSLAIERELRTALLRENAIIHDFQLRSVTLPAQNEQKIIDSVVAVQRAATATNSQQQNLIRAQETVITAAEDQQRRFFQSNKTREATILTQTAAAQGKALELDAQSSVFTELKERLGFSSSQLLRYVWLKTLRDLPHGAAVTVGFDAATINVAP